MLEVLYEDNHIIVVLKPQNVPSQEDSSGDLDMLTMVKQHIKNTANKPGEVYVGLLHRLDRPTGGVMMFAKTSKAAARLSQQIKDGVVTKKYLAVVDGAPRFMRDNLVHYLKKDMKNNIVSVVPQTVEGAKYAELYYTTLEVTESNLALLDIELKTGRSHQIRVQLGTIGHAIIGDLKYAKPTSKKAKNLALWAYNLKFEHPTTKLMHTYTVYPDNEKFPWNSFNYFTAK